jgi:hypothetical protein
VSRHRGKALDDGLNPTNATSARARQRIASARPRSDTMSQPSASARRTRRGSGPEIVIATHAMSVGNTAAASARRTICATAPAIVADGRSPPHAGMSLHR